MTYDKTSVAGKAIQAINKKQTVKGELYDTQGIEGLRRVPMRPQRYHIGEHPIKQSGRDWLIEQFIKWNFGDSDVSFGTQEIHHGIDLVEAQEREKFNDAGQIRTLIKERDAMRDERIKQETAKKIFEELELHFGPVFEKEKKQYKVEP